MNHTPNLQTIAPQFHEHVLKIWNPDVKILQILAYVGTDCMAFVFDNMYALQEIGKYEEALFHAYTVTRTNFAHWSFDSIKYMFNRTEPAKMRAAGDAIPAQAFFRLYRGVSGKGRARRVNGYSWSASPTVAAWFAQRFNLSDPAVYEGVVPNENILACCIDRQEAEYLVKLPLPNKPKRLKHMPKPISLNHQSDE